MAARLEKDDRRLTTHTVNHLFEMFLPNSHGNFNHFFKIFQHLVRRHPCDMLDFVISRDNASIVFNYMLPYLTESAVMDSILSLIFVRDINPETKQEREKSHERLYQLGFLEWIVSKMQMKGMCFHSNVGCRHL